MGSEDFKNCGKGWIWTFVIHFKKQQQFFIWLRIEDLLAELKRILQ
jgi:hypothetical protein